MKNKLFSFVSWAVVIIGLILVGKELYNLFVGLNLSSNFITGLALLYEGLKISKGEIPNK